MSVNSGVVSAQGAAMSALILGAGGPGAGAFLVQWTGPFDPGEYLAGGVYFRNVRHGSSFSVTAAQAAQLSASDPAWWVIVG